MKTLISKNIIKFMCAVLISASTPIFAQTPVNVAINTTAYCCVGTTYSVTFTGIASGLEVLGSSAPYSWNNSYESCTSYFVNGLDICMPTLGSSSTATVTTENTSTGEDGPTFTVTFIAIETSVSGATSLCGTVTSPYTYTATVNAPGPFSYSWEIPTTILSGSSSASEINTTVVAAGTGTITVSSNCCPAGSPSNTASIGISAAEGPPAAPGTITGIAYDYNCPGNIWALSLSAVPTATDYLWTNNVIYTGEYLVNSVTGGPSNVLTIVDNNAASKITVQAENACGVSAGSPSSEFSSGSASDCRLHDPVKKTSKDSTMEHLDTRYKLYPNPSKGQLTIEYNNEQTDINADIRVYYVTGQLVLNTLLPANQNNVSINTSGFAAGIYTYIIGSGDKVLQRGNIAIKR